MSNLLSLVGSDGIRRLSATTNSSTLADAPRFQPKRLGGPVTNASTAVAPCGQNDIKRKGADNSGDPDGGSSGGQWIPIALGCFHDLGLSPIPVQCECRPIKRVR